MGTMVDKASIQMLNSLVVLVVHRKIVAVLMIVPNAVVLHVVASATGILGTQQLMYDSM